MRRALRRRSASIALVCVCFLQIATAAHACDLAFGAREMASAEGVPCDGTPMPDAPGRSNLCVEHCKAGAQAVDVHPPLAAIEAPAAPADFRVPSLGVDRQSLPADVVTPRATAPPVFASSHRLRI